MIVFACSVCQRSLQVGDHLSGKAVKCPGCGQTVRATTTANAPPASALPTRETVSLASPQDAATLPPQPTVSRPSAAPRPQPATAQPQPPAVPGYEVVGELGRGGMGVVYKARDVKLKRLVALKMILSGAHAGEAELTRFRAEAEVIARLQHPNIVQIHEVGEHQGLPYAALEFVDGGSLSAQLRGQPLSGKAAAEVVEALAQGVQAAHALGIVHRDLKPANVLLARTDPKHGLLLDGAAATASYYQPKVTDFGLAKQLDADTGQTRSGAVMGTPSYMAPEQAEGSKQIGPAADVYALGAILYELLTGRPPFRADTVLNTLLQVVSDEPVPPSRLQSRVPHNLETICLKCLHKDPRKRYPSAQALAEDLRRFLAGEPIQARAAGPVERGYLWARRRPAVAALLASTILVFLTGFALTAWQWLRAEDARGQAVANANQAETAKQEAEAFADREHKAHKEAEVLRKKADDERLKAQRLLTTLALDRSVAAHSQGDPVAGLLWLVRSLENVPADEPELERFLRTSLGTWAADLPPLQVAPMQHDAPIKVVTFNRVGDKILTGSNDGTARLWEAATGKPIGKPLAHGSAVYAAAISDKGRIVVTGGQNGIAQVWDAATGKPVATPLDPGKFVRSPMAAVAISPDEQMVVTGNWSGVVWRWKLADGKAVGTPMALHKLHINSVSFSPDGKTILSASSDHTAQLWNAADGRPVGQPLRHQGEIFDARFSPDGQVVATASGDKTVRLWDARTGEAIGTALQHKGGVHHVAFRADGKILATGAYDRYVRLWSVPGGQPLGDAIEMPDGTINALEFSPKGDLLLTAHPTMALVWDLAKNQVVGPPFVQPGGIDVAAFGRDGKTVLTGGKDMAARLWQIRTRATVPTLTHRGEAVVCAISPNGKVAAVGTTFIPRDGKDGKQDAFGEVSLIDVKTNQLVCPPMPQEQGVSALAFSPDSKTLLSTNRDKTARLWSATTGQPLTPPLQHPTFLLAGAFSPDGRLFATGSDKVYLWNVATGQAVGKPLRVVDEGVVTIVSSIAFSPDSRRVAGGTSKGIRVWTVATGDPIGPLLPHLGNVQTLAFSADGDTLLTACQDGAARLWDPVTGNLRTAPMRHQAFVSLAAFCREGRSILTASTDGMVRLWDATTGKPLGSPMLHRPPLRMATVSPDGRLILVSCGDSSAHLWDAGTTKPLGPPVWLGGPGYVVAFAPDSQSYLAGAHVPRTSGATTSRTGFHPVPLPIQGTAEHIRTWVEVITGCELQANGALRALDASEWFGRRQQLDKLGGPPAR